MKSIFHFLFIFGGIVVFNYVDAAVDNRCTLPILKTNPTGELTCMAHIPMYGYESSTKECVEFIYGGCGGNANRFVTLNDCEKACKENASEVVNTDQ